VSGCHISTLCTRAAPNSPTPTHAYAPVKSPNHPFNGAGHNLFYGHLLAVYASFFTPLHFGASLCYATLRYIPFIFQHTPQQPTASVAPFSTLRKRPCKLHCTAAKANCFVNYS